MILMLYTMIAVYFFIALLLMEVLCDDPTKKLQPLEKIIRMAVMWPYELYALINNYIFEKKP